MDLEGLMFVLKQIVIVFLSVVQIAMLLRAVLSWFPIPENRFVDLLYYVTEPFIVPIRLLFDKLGWFSGMPIDISFMVSYLIITVTLVLLP